MMTADIARRKTIASENGETESAKVVPWDWEEGPALAHNFNPPLVIAHLFDRIDRPGHSAAGDTAGDTTAVITETAILNRASLIAQVTALARHLRAASTLEGSPIGLCLEPSPELVTGYLAIMAAGGVVMPLDPLLPSERLIAMAEGAGATRALVHLATASKLAAAGALDLIHVEAFSETADGPAATLPFPLPAGDQIAVLYHTSGSTGRPKPVAIDHQTLARRLTSMAGWFGLKPGEVISGTSSLAFDPFLQQLFFPHLCGGTLWLPSRATLLDGPAFWREARAAGLTHLNMVPSQLEALLESASSHPLPSLLRVVLGGERMPPDLPARIRDRLGDVAIYNMYGPTECTVDATGFQADPRVTGAEIPIGRPLPGCRVRLLSDDLHRVPLGEAGEICIGGAGLARGYAGMAEETAARFVADPFGEDGDRLYRTGDLARWRPDGTLSFIGRRDEQIKVRGQRLELGEVEAALRQQPGVTATAAVLWKEAPGGAAVVAYITTSVGKDATDPDTVRKGVARLLPAAAVPNQIVVLAEMPHLPSGKIDRKALPLPSGMPAAATASAAPHPAAKRADLQRAVAAVWAALLNGAAPGVDVNLFDAGVHSLLVVKAQARFSALAGREISTVDIFRFPTIAGFAAYLAGDDTSDTVNRASAAPVPLSGIVGSTPIAVVGLALRLPGADTADAFWANLLNGTDSTRRFTDRELAEAGADPQLTGHPDFVPVNAALDGFDRFDPLPFGYTPADAAEMDPQQRLLLETAWHALEDAGCDPRQDGPVGVFTGVGFNAYLLDNLNDRSGFAGGAGRYFLVVNNDKDFAATRLAYKLGLTGPAMTVATACSTGLATVAQAVDSLRLGRCRVALAGAASAGMFSPFGYIHTEGGISSRSGICRPFDAAADGTIGGAGTGVVVLKRLDDALADGDTVHAVIRGAGIANDGAVRAAFSAPAVDGQAAAIRAALIDAGVPASSIGYVEGHGTATPMGDPIEVAALNLAYAGAQPESIVLGSLKGNIGHLDTAAGMAGFIKAVLTVKHGQIPPIAHFASANPAIPFAQGPFRPASRPEPWPERNGPRRAGVSSFGMGGTNLHLIVEQAPDTDEKSARDPAPAPALAPRLLVVSGATPTARDRLAGDLAIHLSNGPHDLDDVARTLARRRRLPYRRFAVARSPQEAAAALTGTPENLPPESVNGTGDSKTSATPPGVALLFPGQGAQHPGMGADLYRRYPRFRAIIDAAARQLPGYGEDLAALLLADRSDEQAARRLADTRLTQPALFAVEYGIARLLEDFGIVPAAVAGHSIGEYVAATLAGVMSFEDALSLVATRGRLMASAPKGAMLAVSMAEEELQALLAEDAEAPEIAVINGARQCVVAGEDDAVARLEQRLSALGRPARRLPVSHAFHCGLLDPILPAFAEAVAKVTLRPADRPILANLTGGFADAATHTDPDYWVRHLRGTVRFADNLRHLLADPAMVLVEAGPGQTLTRFARAAGASAAQVLTTQPPPAEGADGDGAANLLGVVGALWLRGVEPDWHGLSWADGDEETSTATGPDFRRVALPPYPFERQRFWITATARKQPDGVVPPPSAENPSVTNIIQSYNNNLAVNNRNNSILAAILAVWQEAIGRDVIAPDDDFLDLGGDSLIAVRIAARLRERTGTTVSPAAIFTHRNAAALAASLDADGNPDPTPAAAAGGVAPTNRPAREEGWL